MKNLILIILLTHTIGYSANNSYVLDKKTPIFHHLISNDTIVAKTEAGKVIRDVGIVGKKVLRKIKELFAVKHKVPKNYISISPVQTYNKDSLGFFINESNLKPSLKLTYPRITPSKGYFSFQLGDYEYFKYFNN